MPATLSNRVAALIVELELLQQELGTPAVDPKTGLAIARLPLGEARHLKSAVDGARLFLWAYIDSHAAGDGDVTARLQRIRMQAATEMLRVLGEDFSKQGLPRSPEAERLCSQLKNMAQVMPDLPS